MQTIDELIASFLRFVASGDVEIYNEFSLQHELGIFLRSQLPTYRVQFERNVSYFFPGPGDSFKKREIDIAIFSADKFDLKYAIELKYPRNGRHPESIFDFCKDVAFGEELCLAGFAQAAAVILVDDRLFYEGAATGIYGFFRGGNPLNGRIQKPTGPKNEEVVIRGTYTLQWKPVAGTRRYAVVQVAPPCPVQETVISSPATTLQP